MKITKVMLESMVKEELKKVLNEGYPKEVRNTQYGYIVRHLDPMQEKNALKKKFDRYLGMGHSNLEALEALQAEFHEVGDHRFDHRFERAMAVATNFQDPITRKYSHQIPDEELGF